MTVRNLDAIFKPRSIALLGASSRAHAVGQVVAHNLLAAGFSGPINLVNPKGGTFEGRTVYADVKSLPETPDLAVIATPPGAVPGLIAELGARGTRGAIVVTAGFAESAGAEGRALEQAMLDAAKPHLLRIIGPNCLGVLSTPVSLDASFAHIAPQAGGLAFVAQSGAMITTLLDWAAARGIGFSHLVSLGDMSDVDFGDMLDFLANDPATNSILLYIEAVTHARKFMSASRAAARMKPVIIIKAGRAAAAAKAAASHTGALAGMDAVYDAAFARSGLLRVRDLDELFDAAETLATHAPVHGDRLVILTNGGGAGVLATDALIAEGGTLASLPADVLARLDAVLPASWPHANPVDIIGDAGPDRYAAALDLVLSARDVDAILVINCPTAIASSLDAADAVIARAKDAKHGVLANWLGLSTAEEARKRFAQARIPSYETPEKAVRGFMQMVRYRRAQDALMEVPPAASDDWQPDDARVRGVIAAAINAGREWLDETEVRTILDSYGLETVRSALVRSAAEAGQRAAEFGGPVALKIYSPDILHKSDVGGVVLGIVGADAVRAAAEAMHARILQQRPKARIEGFVVQEMIRRENAQEIILGMAVDAQFGPFLLFGHGGTAVEVIDDKAIGLPPLNPALAREMMTRTRIYRQLQGYRGQPAADLEKIAISLVRLSQLICEHDEIVELDINPLLVDASSAIALDARIRVQAMNAGTTRGTRLCIRPYPRDLISLEEISGLGQFLCRPIRPEDAGLLVAFFERLDPNDIRLRFFSALRSLPPNLLARLSQIDYDREMALLMLDHSSELMGVARISADPDNRAAEFAVTVRSDLKGHGVGLRLMQKIIAYARSRGIGEIFGDVLAENTLMLALAQELGFSRASRISSPGVVRVSLRLAPEQP